MVKFSCSSWMQLQGRSNFRASAGYKLYLRGIGTHQPIKHLLLIDFIGAPIETFLNLIPTTSPAAKSVRRRYVWRVGDRVRASAAATVPCPNPVCELYDGKFQETLLACDLPIDLQHQIECNRCGFVLRWSPESSNRKFMVRTGSLWDEALLKMVGDDRISISEMARRLAVSRTSICRHICRLGVWRKGWSFNKSPHIARRRQQEVSNRKHHRATFRKAVEKHPELSLSQLKIQNAAAYAYLLRARRQSGSGQTHPKGG